MHEYYAQENGKNLLRNYVTRRKWERRNTNKQSIQISDNQPA